MVFIYVNLMYITTMRLKNGNTFSITIICDNQKSREDLETDWGFSCLINIDNQSSILFDCASCTHILAGNMEKLGLDFQKIDTVFISHHHFDHCGGLAEVLWQNSNIKVILPASLRGVHRCREVIHIDKGPRQIDDCLYSSGKMAGIEQSLFLEMEEGILIICGCAHPGLDKIIKKAAKIGKPYALLGGFHGFSKLKKLESLKWLYPMHCTQKTREIAQSYPEKYVPACAGSLINQLGVKDES